MSLLIACFCHDLDHRGYTNAFLRETDAPLSALYSSSLLENHHFTQTLALLQIPGLNIFSHLTEQQHKKVCSIDSLLFNVVTVNSSISNISSAWEQGYYSGCLQFVHWLQKMPLDVWGESRQKWKGQQSLVIGWHMLSGCQLCDWGISVPPV